MRPLHTAIAATNRIAEGDLFVAVGSGAVGAIPLPSAGGVAMKNVSVAADAEVKGAVTRITKRSGWVVLNADDPRAWRMRRPD